MHQIVIGRVLTKWARVIAYRHFPRSFGGEGRAGRLSVLGGMWLTFSDIPSTLGLSLRPGQHGHSCAVTRVAHVTTACLGHRTHASPWLRQGG